MMLTTQQRATLSAAVHADPTAFAARNLGDTYTLKLWCDSPSTTSVWRTEARAFHGVVETPMAEFLARYSTTEIREVEVPDPLAAIAWYRTQVGKGYDYLAVFGAFCRRDWQEDSKWQCAEGLEMSFVHAGRPRFRNSPSRISPNVSSIAA